MRRVLLLLAVLAFTAATAQAAPFLVVSGDSNLGNALNGTIGAPPGNNAVFFTNLLGGGSKVVFRTTTNIDSTETTSQAGIIGFYAGLGVTVNQLGTFAASDLVGADLLIGFLPDVAFSAGELSAMQSFLAGGGRVLLTGEWKDFDTVADTNINAALAFLGSTMNIVPASLDLSVHTAVGTQIAVDPLMAGVNEFVYAAASQVTGGTPLVFATTGEAFMAAETPVPEPGTLTLLSLGALGFARRLFRK